MVVSPHPLVPRVERQHRLIEELRACDRRPLTADSLAGRLGVSVRTIERDVADLLNAGVPIATRRGPGGGYRIRARSRLPPVAFDAAEASALVVSLAAIGPWTSASAQTAMAKLLDALTEGNPGWPPS
ncbi:helix-turn-helix transcriptional regulator [Nonomuraea typhae]|uniref:helix-turn-helix transcriptional regulator n=1 Tax=Nonomuraea typhae TaxID=2603600 RepID=UPI0012FBAD70|nr:HTH domain-containing protein [Nonomuraea typhae]